MKQSPLQLLGRLVLAIFLVAPFISKAAGKPNVLFIFADDQCYETIGALGLTDIDTPNLDRLAANGVDPEDKSLSVSDRFHDTILGKMLLI